MTVLAPTTDGTGAAGDASIVGIEQDVPQRRADGDQAGKGVDRPRRDAVSIIVKFRRRLVEFRGRVGRGGGDGGGVTRRRRGGRQVQMRVDADAHSRVRRGRRDGGDVEMFVVGWCRSGLGRR